MSSAASFIGSLVEKGAQGLTKRMEQSSLGRGVLNLAGNKEWELELNPEGKAIKEMNEDYHRIRASSLGSQTKYLDAVKSAYHQNNNLRGSISLERSPLADYSKVPGAHTQAINELNKINPEYLNHPLPRVAEMIKGQARLDGIMGSYGKNYENLVPLIASMKTHPDPRVNLNAGRVLDIISNELQDTKINAKGAEVSDVKQNVRKAFEIYNKVQRTIAKHTGTSAKTLPLFDTKPTYERPTDAEHKANYILRMVQIPFVAIPHIGQYFHIPMSFPATAIGKALFQMNKQQMKDTIEASGILAHSQWDAIHSDLLARTGQIAKWTNSPTAASILQKTIHTPLFNWMRLRQLSLAGSVGFHSAIYWGHAALSGDKRALAELTEMGINPSDVIRRGGKLTQDELEKGVYHSVNNRFFFDKSIDNSLYQNRNVFLRSAMMYHSFVSSETAYLRRELLKMSKAGDIKGIAQFAGTLGIVFPAFAPMLKSAEILARTASPQQAGSSMQKDYANLSGANGVGEFTSTYFEMLAHIGATGAYFNYMNAIKANRLANAALGPMMGMIATDTEDIVNAARGKNIKPLGRDITQMIPLVGKPLSHKLFPTTKEEAGEKTSTLRFKHSFGRRKRRF